MSAAEKAAARRKAILSRGNDRLAKLTTSARGENAPAYMHDDPPLPSVGTSKFLGETTDMPTPRRPTPSAHTTTSDPLAGGPDPSLWSSEQQQMLMQALMGGNPSASTPPFQPAIAQPGAMPALDDNPFAALLANMPPEMQGAFGPSMGGNGATKGFEKSPAVAVPKTLLQKLLPLLQFVGIWTLLAYFVFWQEPKAKSELGHEIATLPRWGRLLSTNVFTYSSEVLAVPFALAFFTLQIIYHSYRLFSGVDPIALPSLLALALPHLPPPIPTVVTTGLRYLRMGSLFLDDISALVFGVGLLVWIGTWWSLDSNFLYT